MKKCPACQGLGIVPATEEAHQCRLMRRVAGLRLREVAARFKVSISYVSLIERGVRPLTPKMMKFYSSLSPRGDKAG